MLFRSLLSTVMQYIEDPVDTMSLSATPVIFFPGFGGNSLYATITSSEFIPAACLSQNLPINESFTVMPNKTLSADASDCLAALLTMDFDSSTGLFSDIPGVQIGIEDFGKLSSVYPANGWPLFETLLSWTDDSVTEDRWNKVNSLTTKRKEQMESVTSREDRLYHSEINLFAAPYDYRYSSPASYDNTGYNLEVKRLVEKAYFLNNGAKVMLIGHSNGGPTMYSFLQSKYISQAWKDKYLEGMVGLSGNFLGQMNEYSEFMYSENTLMQNMTCSWEAQYASAPYGGYNEVYDVPVFTTYDGSENESKYTSALLNMTVLFDSIGRNDWSVRLAGTYASMNRIRHPQTKVFCLYGSGIDTSYGFVFNTTINEDTLQTVLYMDGDGNQDHIDNEYCNVWNDSSYDFVAKSFPGVSHMEMVSDDSVMEYLYTILVK